ncbi:MAG: class I SAM-dependent methyltransferase [Saprospiraceae bacterium]
MEQKDNILHEKIKQIARQAIDRADLWIKLSHLFKWKNCLEIGVWQGEFAQCILENCPTIERYYLLDPWKNLSDWNKPLNQDDTIFEAAYQETLTRTNFAQIKRRILRGRTVEVIHQIENCSLDFIYIDADHTLRGITIDLINSWHKCNTTGWIGGDDFCPSIWQHSEAYEPTLIFPYAVYFAEAMSTTIYALPFDQFIIKKGNAGFKFIDLVDGYQKKTIGEQLKLKQQKSKWYKWRD